MPQNKTLRLILGDQLNENHTWFKQPEKNVTYVLMEIRQETDYVAHHIQKVASFFAAMRSFADRLRELGHPVVYLKLDDPKNRHTIAENITELLRILLPKTSPSCCAKKNSPVLNIYCPMNTGWTSSCRN
jgi:deoxyribodipyrimidine photolyase-related protein